MATVHREPNQVKWVGVRPGHNGEQILIDILTAVAVVLYTVPADKLLLIFNYSYSCQPNGANYAFVQLRNALDVVYYTLGASNSAAGASSPVIMANLWVPIEVPAGHDLYFNVVGTSRGGIHGILIDA